MTADRNGARCSLPVASPSHGAWKVPLQDHIGIGVGLLQIDAPVFELFEWDREARHRTAHERTGPHDAKITVEILDLRLARHRRGTIGSIEHIRLRRIHACAGALRTGQTELRYSGSPSEAAPASITPQHNGPRVRM